MYTQYAGRENSWVTPRVGGEVVPTAPRQLLSRQSSLLLPGAASNFLPSWAKRLWQFSAMHCLSEGCWCLCVCVYRGCCGYAHWGPASRRKGCVCVCVCENVPRGCVPVHITPLRQGAGVVYWVSVWVGLGPNREKRSVYIQESVCGPVLCSSDTGLAGVPGSW